MSLFGSMIQGVWNYNIAGYQNKINKEIADQNLQFQKDNLEYQKELQQQIFEREDTAYQRKVNDLIAAGINPAVAASGSGSPAVLPVYKIYKHNTDRKEKNDLFYSHKGTDISYSYSP